MILWHKIVYMDNLSIYYEGIKNYVTMGNNLYEGLLNWFYGVYLAIISYVFTSPQPIKIETYKPTYEILHQEMSHTKGYYDFDDLMHDYFNSSIAIIATIIGVLWVIDYCLRKFVLTFSDTTARWYVLHCISNACVVWFAWDNFWAIVSHPDNVMQIRPTYSPLNITIALHFYHMLFFDNLVMIDWIHHILMISIAVISYGYTAPIIVSTNSLLMFLNGLPGCIDYLLLTLVKMKIIDKMTEKHVNIYLNLCIRSPGVIVSTYLLYLTLQKLQEIEWYNQVIVYGILLWNSQYFLLRVIGNYAACYLNKKYNKTVVQVEQPIEQPIEQDLTEEIKVVQNKIKISDV